MSRFNECLLPIVDHPIKLNKRDTILKGDIIVIQAHPLGKIEFYRLLEDFSPEVDGASKTLFVDCLQKTLLSTTSISARLDVQHFVTNGKVGDQRNIQMPNWLIDPYGNYVKITASDERANGERAHFFKSGVGEVHVRNLYK